jgi:hypothetical protein
VRKYVARITTTDAASLGLHPLVYFYTRGGKFQPIVFLAMIRVVDRMIAADTLDRFIDVRKNVESFLLEHKEAFTLILKKQGSGARSRPAIEAFLEAVIAGFQDGKDGAGVMETLATDRRFSFIATPQPDRGDSEGKEFSTSVKTAAFVNELTKSGVKCGICSSLVHRNSIHTDHVVERARGGAAHAGNAQLAHPYCDSTYKRRRSEAA